MKSWWKSKTVWSAFFIGLLGVLQAAMDSGLLDARQAGYALIGAAVLKLVLRFVTTGPIGKVPKGA